MIAAGRTLEEVRGVSDRDPQLAREPALRRQKMARDIQRRMAACVVAKRGSQADAPLALPKQVYTDPARHEAERQALFLGQPIVAGLSGDIPHPGDLLVFDAAGPSILVTRDKEGRARAFLNMCTHRAAKLVEASEPHAEHRARITCPFHAWTFDAGGRLIGQPDKQAFADCAIGARDLVELPCAEHIGMIFVRPGGGAPIDAAAHLGEMGEILSAIELHRAVPVKKGVLTADSNWKFALDTYGEGYHFATLHASTIGQTHYNGICHLEPFGRHHRVGFPDRGYDAFAALPAAEWPAADYGGVHFIFPNTVVFFGAVVPGSYFTQIFRLFPDGVGKTRCQFAVYAPFGVDSEQHRAMCEAAYDATATVVQTEDYRVASHGYANLLTAPEDFRVVLGANEPALHNVHRHIADAIGMPLE